MANNEQNNVGRPTIMTEIIIGKLESAFKIGANDREACAYANINPDTLYEYQKKHPEFTEQKAIWKQNPILKAKQTVFRNLEEPNTAKWYLERKCKDEFSVMQKHDISAETVVKKIFITQDDINDINKEIDDILNE